jgi:hypothetical protein
LGLIRTGNALPAQFVGDGAVAPGDIADACEDFVAGGGKGFGRVATEAARRAGDEYGLDGLGRGSSPFEEFNVEELEEVHGFGHSSSTGSPTATRPPRTT